MKIDIHKENIKESLDVLQECVQKGIIGKRQKTIGFHCSSASIEMFEIYLHKLNLLSLSAQLKHSWFLAKNKMQEKLPFEFPEKENITSLIYKIEEKRSLLCYGKRQPENVIEEDLLLLEKMKLLMKKLGVEYE